MQIDTVIEDYITRMTQAFACDNHCSIREKEWAYCPEFLSEVNEELINMEDLDPKSLSPLDRSIIVPQLHKWDYDCPAHTVTCIHCAKRIEFLDFKEGQSMRCPFCLHSFHVHFPSMAFSDSDIDKKKQAICYSRITIFREHNDVGEVYYSLHFGGKPGSRGRFCFTSSEEFLSKIETSEWKTAKNGRKYRVSSGKYRILYSGNGEKVQIIDIYYPYLFSKADMADCCDDYDDYYDSGRGASLEEMGQMYPCEGY